MPTLVLLRHGQSTWNLEKRFTGWVDGDLTPQGEAEATRGGDLLKQAGLEFDRAYASVLTRAIRTADLALARADQLWIPLAKSWRLNERHYGGLTGKTHAEGAATEGNEQVQARRRSYDVPPPPPRSGGPEAASAKGKILAGNPLLIPLDAALGPAGARYLDQGRAERLPAAA